MIQQIQEFLQQAGTCMLTSSVDSVFIPDVRNVAAIILVVVITSLANAAGVGGGAVFVPILQALCGFGVKDSAALSQAMITAGSVVSVCINMYKRSPLNPSKPLINFDLALLMTPLLLAGVAVGVQLNRVLPSWLISLCLMAVLLAMVLQTGSKAQQLRAAEEQQAAASASASAVRRVKGAAGDHDEDEDITDQADLKKVVYVPGLGQATSWKTQSIEENSLARYRNIVRVYSIAGSDSSLDEPLMLDLEDLEYPQHSYDCVQHDGVYQTNACAVDFDAQAEICVMYKPKGVVGLSPEPAASGDNTCSQQMPGNEDAVIEVQTTSVSREESQQEDISHSDAGNDMGVKISITHPTEDTVSVILEEDRQQQDASTCVETSRLAHEGQHARERSSSAVSLSDVQGQLSRSLSSAYAVTVTKCEGVWRGCGNHVQQMSGRLPVWMLHLPWNSVGGLVVMWAVFACFQVASVQVVKDSLPYWMLLTSQLAAMVAAAGVQVHMASLKTDMDLNEPLLSDSCAETESEQAAEHKLMYQQDDSAQDVLLISTHTTTSAAAAAAVKHTHAGTGFTAGPDPGTASGPVLYIPVLAGVLAGTLGLGGGMFIGPMLLELNTQPQIAAATSSIMVMFSSSAALLGFLLFGRVNLSYSKVMVPAAAAAAALGVTVVSHLVHRTGRPSYVVFGLAMFFACALLTIGGFGLISIAQEL